MGFTYSSLIKRDWIGIHTKFHKEGDQEKYPNRN